MFTLPAEVTQVGFVPFQVTQIFSWMCGQTKLDFFFFFFYTESRPPPCGPRSDSHPIFNSQIHVVFFFYALLLCMCAYRLSSVSAPHRPVKINTEDSNRVNGEMRTFHFCWTFMEEKKLEETYQKQAAFQGTVLIDCHTNHTVIPACGSHFR